MIDIIHHQADHNDHQEADRTHNGDNHSTPRNNHLHILLDRHTQHSNIVLLFSYYLLKR